MLFTLDLNAIIESQRQLLLSKVQHVLAQEPSLQLKRKAEVIFFALMYILPLLAYDMGSYTWIRKVRTTTEILFHFQSKHADKINSRKIVQLQ